MATKSLPEEMEQLALFGEESICSSAEPRVRGSASRENREDCATTEACSASPLYDFLKQCVPDGSSGKMYRASLAPGGGRISEHSCARLMKSGLVAHGVCWTLNLPEFSATLAPFLKDDGVCSLSDILLPTGVIPLRYFLSRTACLGIIHRSESRQKLLPPILKEALERQATEMMSPPPSTPESAREQITSSNAGGVCPCKPARYGCAPENRGGGEGSVSVE